MRRSLQVAVVVVLASAGFAVASIASGSSVLGSNTTVTATTTAPATTATTTVTITRPTPAPKVTICHFTGSKKHPFVTIRVSANSLFAHFVVHHDLPGACTKAKEKKIMGLIRKAKHRH